MDPIPSSATCLYARDLPRAPRSVLVPVDFTAGSEIAAREALSRVPGDGEIFLVHAIDPSSLGHLAEVAFAAGLPFVDHSVVEDCAIHLRQLRDSCLEGLAAVRLLVRQGTVVGEIVRAVTELRPDLVLFAVDDPPIGHIVRAVIERTSAPILVVAG